MITIIKRKRKERQERKPTWSHHKVNKSNDIENTEFKSGIK